MPGLALYRLPRQTAVNVAVQPDGGIEVLGGYEELNGRSGFVIAPFVISEETPLLLLKPGYRTTVETKGMAAETARRLADITRQCGDMWLRQPECSAPATEEEQHEAYGRTFRRFHKALCDGTFRKLVLARRVHIDTQASNPISLFAQACELYPRMFIALISTPQSGTWLMATPEILLTGDGKGRWGTMALAGTMKLKGEELRFDNPTLDNVQDIRWSQKNIQEQRYVATYISERLERHAVGITEEGPYTIRAANLVHLRSDFSFRMKDKGAIGDLISALHPTPAVCGISKEGARRFITGNEGFARRYYSGFAGELSPDGSTELFVSLRCMEILNESYDLYAGGGLLKDSEEQKEWEETVAKMSTMLRLVHPSPTFGCKGWKQLKS